jgi:hypothetical protein
MNLDAEVFTIISMIAAVIGGALFLRVKVFETERNFQKHLDSDTAIQGSILDRLARLETKIDLLLTGKRE